MQFPFAIRPEAEYDVVGFGTNAVDYLIRVPQYPAFNSKVELTEYTVAAGGEIASTLTGLARLGMSCRYVGRFGSDEAGSIGLSSLAADDVDLTYAETISGALTQVAFIIVDEQTGERTVIWKRDEKLSYRADEVPLETATLARVLHLTPHDGEAAIRMASAAKAAGVVVSVDVDNIFGGLTELLTHVDICIASADLPGRLLGIADRESALRAMSERFGCSVTGVTLGRLGSMVYCGGEIIASPGFDVPGGCVDTTGAGDAFRAGFLFGLLSGATVEQSAECGNAVAALKCRREGARPGLPDRSELGAILGRAV